MIVLKIRFNSIEITIMQGFEPGSKRPRVAAAENSAVAVPTPGDDAISFVVKFNSRLSLRSFVRLLNAALCASQVITNDGSEENCVRLVTLKNIFAKQVGLSEIRGLWSVP